MQLNRKLGEREEKIGWKNSNEIVTDDYDYYDDDDDDVVTLPLSNYESVLYESGKMM